MSNESDDGFDREEPKGRILRMQADYALPPGQPALQHGKAEFESEPQPAVVDRRRILVLCAGASVLSAAGVCVGVWSARAGGSHRPRVDGESRATAPQKQAFLSLAEVFATGSFDRLVDNHATFIWIVHRWGDDDDLLLDGAERLAKFALVERGEVGASIAHQLSNAYDEKTPPRRLNPLMADLREFARRWEARKR